MESSPVSAIIRFATITAVLTIAPAFCGDSELDRQWKARAFQAVENLDSLLSLVKNNKSARYSAMLEWGFANHIKSALYETVRKKTPKILAYHILIKVSESQNSMLDVVYIYDRKTEELIGVRIDKLPERWGVLPDVTKELSFLFTVSNLDELDKPSFLFDKRDPFNALIIDGSSP